MMKILAMIAAMHVSPVTIPLTDAAGHDAVITMHINQSPYGVTATNPTGKIDAVLNKVPDAAFINGVYWTWHSPGNEYVQIFQGPSGPEVWFNAGGVYTTGPGQFAVTNATQSPFLTEFTRAAGGAYGRGLVITITAP
jgi:hypothetical protein